MPIPPFNLIRTRRKTIALIVQPDGTLTVRAPLRMPDVTIHAFVQGHEEWIVKTRVKVRAFPPIPVKKYEPGETFLYLGKPYPLEIVPRQRPALSFDGQTFHLARLALPRAREAFIRWYKNRATEILSERVLVTARKYSFSYKKIRISSARSRWGSSSSTGTLSFTYRLIMAPLEVVDYVIIHELVHTRVRNHSKIFWQQVGELMPDYKQRMLWLKKNSRQLN
jgi:predicted metal-dependent hydrolase